MNEVASEGLPNSSRIVLNKGEKSPTERQIRLAHGELFDPESHKKRLLDGLEAAKRNVIYKIPTHVKGDVIDGVNRKLDEIINSISSRLQGDLSLEMSDVKPLSNVERDVHQDFEVRTNLDKDQVFALIDTELRTFQDILDYVQSFSDLCLRKSDFESRKELLADNFQENLDEAIKLYNDAMDIIGGEPLVDSDDITSPQKVAIRDISKCLSENKDLSSDQRQVLRNTIDKASSIGNEKGNFKKRTAAINRSLHAIGSVTKEFVDYFNGDQEGGIPEVAEEIIVNEAPATSIKSDLDTVLEGGEIKIVAATSEDVRELLEIEEQEARNLKEAEEKRIRDLKTRKNVKTWSMRLAIPLVLAGGIAGLSVLSGSDNQRNNPEDPKGDLDRVKGQNLFEAKKRVISLLSKLVGTHKALDGSSSGTLEPKLHNSITNASSLSDLLIKASKDIRLLDARLMSDENGHYVNLDASEPFKMLTSSVYGRSSLGINVRGEGASGNTDENGNFLVPLDGFCKEGVEVDVSIKPANKASITVQIANANNVASICKQASNVVQSGKKVQLGVIDFNASLDEVKQSVIGFFEVNNKRLSEEDFQGIQDASRVEDLEDIIISVFGSDGVDARITHYDTTTNEAKVTFQVALSLSDGIKAAYRDNRASTDVVHNSFVDVAIGQDVLATSVTSGLSQICSDSYGLHYVVQGGPTMSRRKHEIDMTKIQDRFCHD